MSIEQIPFDDFGGQGPMIHFAHANGYPPACYRQLLEVLTEEYHVMAGHLRPLWPGSQPEEIEKWHDLADDLIRYLEQQASGPVIGMGHSLGAVVTMIASLKRPDLFTSLVLLEPVFLMPAILTLFSMQPEATQSAHFPLVKIASSRRNEWADREEAFKHFRRKRVFSAWSDSALWDYINHGLFSAEEGGCQLRFAPAWEARIYALPPTDVWELLPQVRHKTLAVRGEHTDTLVPASWEMWQVKQPEATFVEIEGAGHLLPMEQPQKVGQIILDFLAYS